MSIFAEIRRLNCEVIGESSFQFEVGRFADILHVTRFRSKLHTLIEIHRRVWVLQLIDKHDNRQHEDLRRHLQRTEDLPRKGALEFPSACPPHDETNISRSIIDC